jgi:hypothetical protein
MAVCTMQCIIQDSEWKYEYFPGYEFKVSSVKSTIPLEQQYVLRTLYHINRENFSGIWLYTQSPKFLKILYEENIA